MNDLEDILEDCVEKLKNGTATLEECIAFHPQYAPQLRPLLESAAGLIHHREDAAISPLAHARGRAALSLYMTKYPHRHKQNVRIFQRLALGLAVVMFALLSVGTVRAQSAMPADLFYTWKLVSERVWRGVSFDRRHVDLVLADRRVSEIVATSNDSLRQDTAVRDYREILLRLEAASEADAGDEILSTLETHQKSLKDAGLSIQELDDYLQPLHEGEKIIPELPLVPVEDPTDIEIPAIIP